MADSSFLSQSYDAYPRIEAAFSEALDESLHPRGPDVLYGLVSELGLRAGDTAVDVGCGEGRHAIELARRFRLRVRGIDPVRRHLDIAKQTLAKVAAAEPEMHRAVSFEQGVAENLPAGDASVDLIWCRDVLVHAGDLGAAYGEFRRVLKPGARALVYQMFTTERLAPDEAAWLLPAMGCDPANMQPEYTETTIRSAGLQVDRCVVLGSEWGEYAQERGGSGGRKLLHAARLLRDPDRYVRRFGKENYDIALGDCLWHVYQLLGKLSGRVYLLSAPA